MIAKVFPWGYIRLMNGVNTRFGMYLLVARQEVEKLSLRFAWLLTLLLWQHQAVMFWKHILLATKAPVPESQYRKLERRAREEYLPIGELAHNIEAAAAWVRSRPCVPPCRVGW